MNVFTCTTRCYKDAELRYTASGEPVASFTGAVDAGFGDKKTTSWIKFNLWGKRFEKLAPYLLDKTQVVVSGELANRKWQDKDGQDRYSLEVRVNDITLVGGKPEGSQRQQDDQGYEPAPQKQQTQRNSQGAPPSKDFSDLDNDIPFTYHARGRIGHCM